MSHEIHKAEELLAEVASWTEDELEALPKFYREKAERYQALAKQGEG